MKNRPAPQQTFLFRLVAFFSRLQFRFLLTNLRNRRMVRVLFVFLEGVTAIGLITFMAVYTDLPLLFPPLGPSAFILFYTPLAEAACPRSIILSHSIGVGSGLFAIWLMGLVNLHLPTLDAAGIDWFHIAAIAIAMGLVSIAMVVLDCTHPPAAATAMIAAMGYLDTPLKIGGLIAAVLLLVIKAFIFNRLLGGLPYPLWGYDPSVVKTYGELAGMPTGTTSMLQRLEERGKPTH